MSHISFTRERTLMLKGVALILMIIHHTSTPVYWAEEGTALYTYFAHQVSSTKMCVYIFAFLVGYGFYCSKNKSLGYSFRRIKKLLIPFWAMLFGLFVPTAYVSGCLEETLAENKIGGGNSQLTGLIFNMFGISETLNWYSWFVCFYILTMLSLPFLRRAFEKNPRYGWLLMIVGYYVIECIIHQIPSWERNPLLHNLFIYTSTIPLVIIGYQCAWWNAKECLLHWFEGKRRLAIALIAIICIMLIKAVPLPVYGFCVQAIYTPILIFAIIGIFNTFELKRINKFLVNVGNLSMYMWFFHALFFTEPLNEYTRLLVFEPFHSWFYTLFMTFILTYCGSWAIKKILTPITIRI